MKRNHIRLAGAAFAALALLGLSAPLALADPGDPYSVGGTNQEATNRALINAGATVQLSIHKILGSDTGLPNNGTEQNPGGTALSGVRFDVYQVFTDAALTAQIDLTTNAGWAAAAAIRGVVLTPTQAASGSFTVGATTYYLGTSTAATTGAGGTATFTKANGVGLYLVNENLAASTNIQQGGAGAVIPSSQVSPAAPFFVTLPMTSPTDLSRWMYDVNVYPKNQIDTATKTVTDKSSQTGEATGAGANHTITYTISTDITDGMTAATMGQYKITDTLDSRLTLESVTATAGATTLIPTTDYTVSGNVVVTLTSSGRGKLVTANTADPAAKVTTTITATVGSEGTLGVISNQASVIPNQAWADANPGSDGIASGSVASRYGDLLVTKADPNDALAVLDDAEFAVYLDPTPAIGAATNTCTTADVSGAAVAVGTTGADSKVTIKGLQTSDFYNGATQTDLLHYCLVETKAPTGYNLSAEAISFTILQNATVLASTSVTVNNQRTNLDNVLPFTGGNGIVEFTVAGLALIGAGTLLYVVSSRRRREHQA